MFAFFVFNIVIISGANGLFVSLGKYPYYIGSDVNLPECGFGSVYKTVNVSFGKQCFYEDYPNTTIHVSLMESGRTKDPVSKRVIGGRSATIGEAPWTVRLYNENNVSCSGVLVTFEWVMTAAHCVEDDMKTKPTTVYAGSNIRHGKEILHVHKIFRHKYYDDPLSVNPNLDYKKTKQTYDIAMVKLYARFSRHLTTDDGLHYLINTICLPAKSPVWNEKKENATFSGFGLTGVQQIPGFVQIGKVHLLTGTECKSGQLEKPKKDVENLCNQDLDDTNACLGDAGAPLVQYDSHDSNRAILIGITQGTTGDSSGGPKSCGPDIYRTWWVPPMRFIPWILETIEFN